MRTLFRYVFAVLLLSVPAGEGLAQQRALDHADVLHWNTIETPTLSDDGQWITYVLTAMEGDPELIVRGAREGGPVLSVRGSAPTFTSDSRYVVFRVPPLEAALDSLKRADTKEEDLPKDSLTVADLSAIGGSGNGSALRNLGPVTDFEVAESGPWVAYLPVESDTETEDEENARPDPGDEGEDEKEVGATLVLLDLSDGTETRFDDVTSFVFAEDAPVLAFATSSEEGDGDGVSVVTLDDGIRHEVTSGEGRYLQLAVSKDGGQVAFLTDQASFGSEQAELALHRAEAGNWRSRQIVDAATAGMPDGWWVGEHGEVAFSDAGSVLRFGTAPRPEPEVEDETLDEDRVSLDVWNWKDPYLQPMQLVQAEEERNRTYAAVAHVGEDGMVQLGTPEVPTVRFPDEGEPTHVLGVTDVPYRQLISWDGRYNDLYAIDTRNGSREVVAERVKGFSGASISPAGSYASWWDGADREWKAARLSSGQVFTMSAGASDPVWNELDDHPDEPPPYGSAGWTEGDGAFLFYDRYDVWRFEPETGRTTNLTAGAGRDAGIRFRYERLDPDLEYVPEGDALWDAFHLTDKRGGYFRGRTDGSARPTQVVMSDHVYRLRDKAEDADRWLVTREDFREFPDLWVTDGSITDMVRMSDANPQQAEFTWGTAEIVEWHSNDGVPLQGMLFKPDGFDPAQEYPTMVYFYERMSDGLNSYRTPRPGGSSISVPFYVSRGYLVFIPDIPYEIGYPGESALDAVVPGVLSLIRQGFVDEDKIGVQGHSWGGYQIAYMVTKTNLFAAAEAGAPVSNMTSAYGGIRWQTGMSRMFQYERTQSRIGGTLWEATNEYLHNSPVFYADKIQTPLLMMHNDEDGAVPWYQGIEMFVAMRRLQKPVWMLNYNGEAHGLRREANRKDWAVRMQQFFDHYLKGAPAPVWLEEGVPAVDKGKVLGTKLIAPEIS